MRSITGFVFIVLVASLGVAAVADDGWASLSGGSRLIFYYTQKSLVNPAAPAGSAATIIRFTNQNASTSVNVRYNIFNGSTCAGFGPVSISVGPRRTQSVNISDQVSASSFPEGWVDVYAVTAGGIPLRWDQLAGKGTILDFGGGATTAATYEAAALFSDDDNRVITSSKQGTVITSNSDGNTFGSLTATVDFWASGGPLAIGNRLIMVPVSVAPGTAPVTPARGEVWNKVDGTQTRNVTGVAYTCMVASTLADLHPSFAANYPNTGSATDGGILSATGDTATNKGFVGWLIETAPIPALSVTRFQQMVGPSKEAHE